MQPFIIPDYLDGSKEPKEDNLRNLSRYCGLSKYIKSRRAGEMVVEFPSYPEPIVDGINLKDLMPIVSQDESMKVFLRAYKAYQEKPNKNIIIHKELVKALSETKLDIKSKYLPKEFTAFLDLKDLKDNDGDEVKGIFVDIAQEEEWMLYLGIVTYCNSPHPHLAVSHLNIPLDDSDKPISEIVAGYKHIYSTVHPDVFDRYKGGDHQNMGGLYQLIFEGGYHKFIHAILNAILYIHHSPEQCIEIQNEFATKKSKLEAQKKIYTSKKFIVLGQNFSFPKEYSCGEVSVSGHFRWQPYGPGWSLMKHIYIKPHSRNYGSGKELGETLV